MNFNVGKSNVGKGKKTFIVAELSGNHNRSLKKAIKLVEEAKKCGIKLLKLQTYTPDTITINSRKKDFLINDKKKYLAWEKFT